MTGRSSRPNRSDGSDRGLLDLYPSVLQRNGVLYPVAVQPWPVGGFEPPAVAELSAEPLPGDEQSRDQHSHDRQDGDRQSRDRQGSEPRIRDEAYLRARLDADPLLTDGPTLCWRSDRDGRLQVEPGGYFDMLASCGALRAEIARSGDWSDPERNPLRARVHELVGDPLASGAARSAAVGVSVVLTVPHQGGRALLIGQRPGTAAGGGGRWHVAPSGMLEQDASGAHVTSTVLRELSEEVGIDLLPEHLGDRLTVLGTAQDLTMLRPDVVVRLDLRPDEVPADLRPVSEFTRFALVPLTGSGDTEFWQAHPPATLLPHAAGAIALAQLLATG